jgi:hypothetical protein
VHAQRITGHGSVGQQSLINQGCSQDVNIPAGHGRSPCAHKNNDGAFQTCSWRFKALLKRITNREKYVPLFICCWFIQANEDTVVEEVNSKPKGSK